MDNRVFVRRNLIWNLFYDSLNMYGQVFLDDKREVILKKLEKLLSAGDF